MPSDQETTREQHWEYQARALVETESGLVNELTTEWDHRRDVIIETAEELRESGRKVQINSRPYRSTVDFDEVPE